LRVIISFEPSSIISESTDFFHLFVTGSYRFLLNRHLGFFHEINYSVGAFFIYIFLQKESRLFKALLIATLIFLFLFCMNVFPFNIFAELPVIKSFRVPQRSFLVLSLFIPVWYYSQQEYKYILKDFGIFIITLMCIYFIPYSEFPIFFFVAFALISNSNQSVKKIAFYLSLSSLLVGVPKKIYPSYLKNLEYQQMVTHFQPTLSLYSKEELRKTGFHINTHENLEVLNQVTPLKEVSEDDFFFPTPRFQRYNFVAQSLGIRTYEGYGHPPLQLIEVIQYISKVKFNENTNWFYFFEDLPNKEEILKAFDIDIVADVQEDGSIVLIKQNAGK
jgi:hypothetical protein